MSQGKCASIGAGRAAKVDGHATVPV